MTINEMLERIDSFKDLKPGWDSYDGESINKATIEFAKRIARMLSDDEGWFVAPCGNGEIHFESNNEEFFTIWSKGK